MKSEVALGLVLLAGAIIGAGYLIYTEVKQTNQTATTALAKTSNLNSLAGQASTILSALGISSPTQTSLSGVS